MTRQKKRLFGLRKTRLASDQSGIAAVEFALILPLMLLLYFGGVEIMQAVMVNRLVDLAATTVTNLTAQYTTISASLQMPDILKASTQVMAPYPTTTVKVVVTCITIDGQGNATVGWSQASTNATALTLGQAVTVPASLKVASTSLILGTVSYAYSPAFDFMKIGPFNLNSQVYMSPRASTTVNLAP